MILSLILKAIRVEVGWLMGFQHTLVALKFGQSDVLDFQPIRQIPRRVLFALQEEISKRVQEMLKGE